MTNRNDLAQSTSQHSLVTVLELTVAGASHLAPREQICWAHDPQGADLVEAAAHHLMEVDAMEVPGSVDGGRRSGSDSSSPGILREVLWGCAR